jgi:hypothetical protein
MNPARDFFNFQAPLYDTCQYACVPRYDEMLKVSTDFIARFLHNVIDVNILDLGYGASNATVGSSNGSQLRE